MREIILVFEGDLAIEEKDVSDKIQSVIFEIMGGNGMQIRHFNDEQVEPERMAAIRRTQQLSQELKIPEFIRKEKKSTKRQFR